MIWAEVMHSSCGKSYWFIVPDNLTDWATVGSNVICDTVNGNVRGRIISVAEMTDITLSTEPTKEIIAIEGDICIRDITIPVAFEKSVPKASKIHKRMREFRRYGEFYTDVTVLSNDSGLLLMDGYTAYLVSKMYDQQYLHGLILSRENV